MSSQSLNDNIIIHMTLVHRLANYKARKIVRLLDEQNVKLFEDINKIKNPVKLLKSVKKISDDIFKLIISNAEIDIQNFSQDEIDWYLNAYEKHNDTDLNVNRTNKKVDIENMLIGGETDLVDGEIIANGSTMVEWVEQIKKQYEGKLFREVNFAVKSEKSEEEIYEIATERKDLKKKINNLIYTAYISAVSEAQNITLEANPKLLPVGMYTAILDGRTTPICLALHGDIYPWNVGPRPPQHFRCRSIFSPLYVNDKSVSQEKDFGKWLEKQDEEFIFELLGEEFGKKFLDKKVKIDEYVDMNKRRISAINNF